MSAAKSPDTAAALLDVLEQAWRMTAPKKLIREYDERTPS